MGWYIGAWRRYGVTSGRARRREFWYFGVFLILNTFLVFFASGVAALLAGASQAGATGVAEVCERLFLIAAFLPTLGVCARRLQDIGVTSRWVLFVFVAPVCFAMLVAGLIDSRPGTNQYGPNPKGSEPAATFT